MNRERKLALNGTVGLINQAVTLTCGIILPPILIGCYGSVTNGIVSSITQFIELINFADLGVISVAEAALYSPIALKDIDKASAVLASARRFFRKIAFLLVIYVIALVFIYPHIIGTQFDHTYTALLIIVLSISTFFQYFMCLTYRILLSADQRNYVYLGIETFCVILNTGLSIVMMQFGFSVVIVKTVVALVYLLRPLFLEIYVKKYYLINWNVDYTGEPIQQKWNGLAQHIAFIVVRNTDVAVLTIFSSLSNVSIYQVHILVVAGLRNFINAITSGMRSFFGNMIAKNENDLLRSTFNIYEMCFHFITTLIFASANTLFVPFINIYTKNIHDTNYTQPLFSSLLVVAYWLLTIRTPYQNVIFSAGHFKQTQTSSIIEALLNIVISIVAVKQFGLIGVSIGTLFAMAYRTIYLVIYIKDKIVFHSVGLFVKNIIGDSCIFFTSFVLKKIVRISSFTYILWIIMAIKVFVILFLVSCLFFLIFNRNYFLKVCSLIKKKINKVG